MIFIMDKNRNVLFQKENNNTLYYSYVASFLFVMAAHGFAFLNFYPGHDSIRHSFYYAGEWEVSLSRFLLPYYGLIKGTIAVPWITGILTVIFVGTATFFICDCLNIYSFCRDGYKFMCYRTVQSIYVCIRCIYALYDVCLHGRMDH